MKDGVSAGVRHVDPVLRRACLAAPLLHSSPTAALPLHVDGDSVPPASATTASTQETLFNPHGVRVTSIGSDATDMPGGVLPGRVTARTARLQRPHHEQREAAAQPRLSCVQPVTSVLPRHHRPLPGSSPRGKVSGGASFYTW